MSNDVDQSFKQEKNIGLVFVVFLSSLFFYFSSFSHAHLSSLFIALGSFGEFFFLYPLIPFFFLPQLFFHYATILIFNSNNPLYVITPSMHCPCPLPKYTFSGLIDPLTGGYILLALLFFLT